MFVGHEFLAFAVAGALTRLLGRDARTAVLAGATAALCALLPDLDVAYGAVVYLLAVGDGAPLSWEAFWGVTNGVHRVVTHPLPVGVAATLAGTAAAAAVRWRRARTARAAVVAVAAALAALGVAAVVVPAMARTGDGAAALAATYLLAVAAVGAAVAARFDVRTPVLALAAAVGLLTHPFGDVFMAAPPPLLSPFAPSPLTDRVTFSADATVNLLAVLFAEVATVWAGLSAYLRLAGRSLGDAVGAEAAVGVGYAAAAFVLPRPTMVDAHYLGFTVVPLAVAVGAAASGRASGPRPDRVVRGVATGLATLTLAAVAYLVAYLAV